MSCIITSWITVLICLIGSIVAPILRAQSISEHRIPLRIAFADGSFELGDYPTAAREYRWLLEHQQLSADSLNWMLARCAFRFDRPEDAYPHLTKISFESPYRYFAALGCLWHSFQTNTDAAMASVKTECNQLMIQAPDDLYDPFWVLKLADAADRRLWSVLDTLKPNRALTDPMARLATVRIYNLIESYRYYKPKSPVWAAICGLIPGGGQAYLGRWTQASVVFMAVAALGLQSRESFNRGFPWLGYSFVGLSGCVWGLSAYSGSIQARESNRSTDDLYAKILRSEVAAVLRPAMAR
jgi:hypothetical protein